MATTCRTSDGDLLDVICQGIPRKQGFNLEFVSYGNDLQNV
ncbi:hypothetical protein [Pseudomonas sp. Leaf58]|nr:hypothetical protein [Pseudomonas sp. Leaf58]